MPLFPIILMAIVQGLGEFLPIGASGQLVLVPTLTGWPDQGLVVDLGAHIGTLIAVLLYFWRDVGRMAAGLLRLLLGEVDEGARLALQVIAASVPGIGLGYLLQRYLGTNSTILVVALTGIGFGILLYLADWIGATFRRIEHMTIGRALIIGTAEALAFLPGVGRAGVAMLVGRLLGYERPDAARFAFLLSIPAIAAIAGAEACRLTGERSWPISTPPSTPRLPPAYRAFSPSPSSWPSSSAPASASSRSIGSCSAPCCCIWLMGGGCRPRPAEDPRLSGCGSRASPILSIPSCVDGPRQARVFCVLETTVTCGHVSGLLIAAEAAGPDGFRGSRPDHGRGVSKPQ